ncbi:imelysin family protein [Neolewinella aurantiaca]|uniref:Imelysin family protein n=1 Tax=Neolewinella aurantiaca TaxID=2602767 RepID=A0A5C7FXS8_9BACT|nr:imelysin family protein [Neolewinella aurantiaca]TXF89798.1 imelysin family protein [Neolewinella aurantiaca]
MQRLLLLPIAILFLTIAACDSNNGGTDDDGPMLPSFDRQAMLTGWANDVIVPAYDEAGATTEQLTTSAFDFAAAPTAEAFDALRADYQAAYLAWQSVSPLLMGRAEEINLRFRANTYPTDTELIEQNIAADDYNLDLPSQTVAQGFPALDYLLYANSGLLLETGPAASARREYVAALTSTLRDLIANAASEWTDAYVASYGQNDGNSATASVDRTVNDYIFHYEKFLRAGKVGIPAGVFSDMPLADRAEALYSGNSKTLFLASLSASETFFNDNGLADYLDALNVTRDGELLSAKIADQFLAIRSASASVSESFSDQVESDNVAMLTLYDEMQRLVVLLKVDMLQALSINVDYVDADGD